MREPHPLRPTLARASRTWMGGITLVLLCALVYIPGMAGIPVVDRDEARFAQASRQMLNADSLEDLAIPRIQDRLRLNKPPLIYWLQATSAKLFSRGPDEVWGVAHADAIWMYRLPSAICATIAVLATWRIGLSMFGGRRDGRPAWFAGALLAVCPMVVWDAHQARADQLLLAMTTLSMGLLWRCWGDFRERGRVRTSIALPLWLFVGLGVLSKGPITPMVVLLTALAIALLCATPMFLWRLRPLLGIAVFVALVIPWVVMVAQSVGLGWYLSEVFDETIGRSVQAKESHWGPPGYHAVLLPALFWPGSLLTAIALQRAWSRSRLGWKVWTDDAASGRPAYLFLLAWIVPSWIVFELVTTKLPHYTLPLYPALALLSARTVFAGSAIVHKLREFGSMLGFRLWAVIGAAFLVVPVVVVSLPVIFEDMVYKFPPQIIGLFVIWAIIGPVALVLRPLAMPTLPENRAKSLLPAFVGVMLCYGVPIMFAIVSMSFALFVLITGVTGALLPWWMLIPFALVIAALVLLRRALRAVLSEQPVRAHVLGIAVVVLGLISVVGVILPRAEAPWLSHRVAEVIAEADSGENLPIASLGYSEDSLIFETRGKAERVSIRGMNAWLNENPRAFLVLKNDLLREIDPTAPDWTWLREREQETVEYVRGFNYSRGETTVLVVYLMTGEPWTPDDGEAPDAPDDAR